MELQEQEIKKMNNAWADAVAAEKNACIAQGQADGIKEEDGQTAAEIALGMHHLLGENPEGIRNSTKLVMGDFSYIEHKIEEAQNEIYENNKKANDCTKSDKEKRLYKKAAKAYCKYEAELNKCRDVYNDILNNDAE